MDLSSIGPSAFLHAGESAIVDDKFDGEEYDDMDVTEVIHGGFIRKPSLSIGLRRPLTQISQTNDQDYGHVEDQEEQSFTSGDSQLQSDDSDESGMEYTMPLDKSLWPSAEHDEAWLALRKETHSGDTPIEPELSSDDLDHPNVGDGMDLDHAEQRLIRARDSLSSTQLILDDDTFSSTEGSFRDEGGSGDQTINVSKVYGQTGLGEQGNIGYQESTMDESEIYGGIVPPVHSTPRQSKVQPPSHEPTPAPTAPSLTVFQPPLSNLAPGSAPAPSSPLLHRPAVPVPFSFTPRPQDSSNSKNFTTAPTSPSKNKSRQTFSAAFAPPVARLTPKKGSVTSPNKRSRPNEEGDTENGDADKPGPAKQPAVAVKWPHAASLEKSVTPAASSPKPKPLSPRKKAPFQVASASGQRPSSSLRRPSDYFARRKSFGTGLGSNLAEEDRAPAVNTRSSLKKGGGGLGRMSLGSGPGNTWTRLENDSGSDFTHAKAEEMEAQQCVREASRQAVASPSPTRGSPAPASPSSSSIRPVSPVVLQLSADHVRTPSPDVPAVDISTLLGPEEFGEKDTVDETNINPTEQWRDGVEPSEFVDDDGPPISIEQFFAMTKIKFMDELTAPRRSTHPSQQPARQARNPDDIPMSEYVNAMGIDVPQLILYSRVSKDLQAWVEKSKADFAQAEDEAAKITPELFTEYSRADEEGQAELLHQLQLIRTNTRGLAKSDWYDWKLQWLEGLRITADKVFKSLEMDARILEGITTTADQVVPALQQEYEVIMEELEKENAEVAEIEASDQDYLNELKASIAEQNIEVEALQAEVAEGQAQLLWLQERLEEVDAQKREASTAITDARRILHIQKNSTRTEVIKLAEELEALEDLHMFRATKVNSDLFEYVYASQLLVSIPCRNFMPMIARVEITRLEKAHPRFKDDFPRLSNFLVDMAKQQIVHRKSLAVRQIVQRLGDYWSSCAQLRSQLKLLTIKYPVEIEILQKSTKELSAFKAKVMVLFPAVKAKAFVSFVFTPKTFCYWPMSIDSLQYDVEVAYGAIDAGPILKAVTERLQQASLEDNYACLLDACIEAQDVYH